MKRTIILFTAILLSTIYYGCSNDDNKVNEQAQYEVVINGSLQTNTCDITTNSYAVQVEYLSDMEIINTDLWTGTQQENASGSTLLSGDVIGVRIRLTNFNPDDVASGRGTGFDDIHIKIIDTESNEALLDQDRNEYLVICTDVIYEVLYLYNTDTGQLTPTLQYHNF